MTLKIISRNLIPAVMMTLFKSACRTGTFLRGLDPSKGDFIAWGSLIPLFPEGNRETTAERQQQAVRRGENPFGF